LTGTPIADGVLFLSTEPEGRAAMSELT